MRACDQCSVPIMQSLKRCACRRPAPPRPSPSPTSLPTISRHFCSSHCLLPWFAVRPATVQPTQREKTAARSSSHSCRSPSWVAGHLRVCFRNTRINLSRTRSFCEIFVTRNLRDEMRNARLREICRVERTASGQALCDCEWLACVDGRAERRVAGCWDQLTPASKCSWWERISGATQFI